MNLGNKPTFDKVKEISKLLNNGFIFNEILTEKNDVFTLTYRKDFKITIKNSYRKDNPQITLYILNDLYNENYREFNKIGCSFLKSTQAIVKDIKNRLLINFDQAIVERKEIIKNKNAANALKEARGFVIGSLTKIIKLDKDENSRFHTVYGVNHKTKNHNVATLHHLYEKEDLFNMDIKSITAQQVIQISKIISAL